MTHTPILHWATNCLTSNGYTLQSHPEIIQETPWSSVFRLSTNRGNVYLKQNPPTLSLEPQIMQLLRHQLHASVPFVIASSDELYCFLTQDAGQTLRQFLKIHFEPNLLSEAIRLFTTIQRSAENDIDSFLSLGVPDWRLNHLPKLYDQLLEQKDFLIADGMTSDEIKILRNLSSTISAQCDLLSQCQIPETLVQPDFNTNNILFDVKTTQMTLIDLGEIVITHPFFSLLNFLLQATIHHGVKENDEFYLQLQNSCCENWLKQTSKKQLSDAFIFAKKLWPIYSALSHYRLMMAVDKNALKSHYPNRPNQLAGHLREYIIDNLE